MAANKKKKPAKKTAPVKKAAAKKASPKKMTKPAAKKAVAKKAAKPIAKKAAVKTKAVAKPKLQVIKPAVRVNLDNFMTPLDDRLLVSIDGAANMTPGGLYIPDSASERPSRGQVLAKGRGKRNKKGQLRPLDVQVGDRVLFAQFAGDKISVSGEELLILREDEILGIVT